ncbi:MAG TPA: hypothetical protein VI451_13280 [Anaerolineales bacterium]|nr:hypothetical protein [Anaerolineales bacterium]
MPDLKKKPVPQTYNLEIAGVGELHLKPDESLDLEPYKGAEKSDLNQDLIHKLIDCLKKI